MQAWVKYTAFKVIRDFKLHASYWNTKCKKLFEGKISFKITGMKFNIDEESLKNHREFWSYEVVTKVIHQSTVIEWLV